VAGFGGADYFKSAAGLKAAAAAKVISVFAQGVGIFEGEVHGAGMVLGLALRRAADSQ
jgi:hypothetical protein